MAAGSPTRKATGALSPTAEALQALQRLSSPAPAPPDDALRIQAPRPLASASGGSGSGSGSGASGALISGPSSISPASGLSAPTSPADEGLDTPDGEAASKRPRLADGAAAPPLFLEKTFEMLDKCAPLVACWSAAGDSFIVKNPVAFAEHVIPVYFKHKNFSSFVRQLNFYGFRKVRVVDPEVTGGVDPKDWWEFRHEKFLRGRKELLREIKRRSLPSAAASGGDAGAARALIDRAEIDELRNEVCTLREQIQTLNKHMFSVMQIMMSRAAPPPGAPPPTVPFPSPHYVAPPYAFAPGLPPPHPSMLGAIVNKNDKRGAASPSTVSSGYALRPIQTFVGSGVPPGYPFPLTPSGDPTVDWEVYSRHAFHAAQAHPPPPQTPSGVGAMPPPNVPPTSSSVPAVPGLKRTRSQQQKRSPSATTATPTAPVNPVENPEAAVRHLSLLVSQIRTDLLQSILSRTLAFIPAQPSGSSDKTQLNPEIDAVAEAIAGDIQQRMVQVNEAEAATHGRPRGSAPSETSHMYRVEMLKFVSKELPRAMSEAVEKRLPPSTKKSLNRSLLALMVQKAQAALESQMRQETANSSNNTGH